MKKCHLRQQIKNTLKQLSVSQWKQKSCDACENLCATEEFRRAHVVMLFLSIEHEIDTITALQTAFAEGKTVLLPKVIWSENNIVPVRFNSLDTRCVPDRYGLRNPVPAEIVPPEKIDLVVVPGLAFDPQANRLGRGGGFYDRFLANPTLHAHRCGFTLHEQVLPEIPTESNDQPMDMLVTDRQILRFEKKL